MQKQCWLAVWLLIGCAAAYAGDGRLEISQTVVPYTITNSGSYVFTENITLGTTNTDAITVAGNDVTIDLNGFALIGPGDNSGHGIYQSSSYSDLAVRNGIVKMWRKSGKGGVYAVGERSRVENITVVSNYYGIYTSGRGYIKACVACRNLNKGISVGAGGRVENCVAEGNASAGISVGSASIVSSCAANENTNGIDASGVNSAMISDCIAYNNSGTGISGGNGSRVAGCVSSYNGSYGIYVSQSAIVEDCMANNNNNGIGGLSLNRFRGNTSKFNNNAGLETGSWKNFFEANFVEGNGIGINANDGGPGARYQILIGNVARLNTTNYYVSTNLTAESNHQIQTNPGTNFVANPWINIAIE